MEFDLGVTFFYHIFAIFFLVGLGLRDEEKGILLFGFGSLLHLETALIMVLVVVTMWTCERYLTMYRRRFAFGQETVLAESPFFW